MNKGGRPKTWTKTAITGLIPKVLDFTERNSCPFLEDFCLENDLCEAHISRFSDINAGFRQAIGRLMRKQKAMVLKGGLTRKFSDGFSKFVLINNHGMKDQSDLNLKGQVSHDHFIRDAISKSRGAA